MGDFEAVVSWRGEPLVTLTPTFNTSDSSYSYSYSLSPAKL